MDELHVFSRAELLLGKDKLEKLKNARVAVFGIGGVGSFAAEAIARGEVGKTNMPFMAIKVSEISNEMIVKVEEVIQSRIENK
ncbi:MAG: ThiF family adenylyltransferase, partial [Anaerotignum sp.]|nr:ThiF family adenylyltransferase [Anaerotignum sp.]